MLGKGVYHGRGWTPHMAKLQKKDTQQEEEDEVDLLEFADGVDADEELDEDYDLDLDSANFQGKKGQAGTRTRHGGSGNGSGSYDGETGREEYS